MEFIYETKQSQNGVTALENTLNRALMKHSRVLWLVCGGSSITKIVRVMEMLPASLSSRLHVMLTDERYGSPGHKDSNYQQLLDSGFDPKQAVFSPVLQADLSLKQTAAAYALQYSKEYSEAGYVVATFGIGPDGHIAGILPGSPAAQSTALAAGYSTKQFKRLTLTFSALQQIDIAYAFAYGDSKHDALVKLQRTTADVAVEPCQILKAIPESYVYNDCIP